MPSLLNPDAISGDQLDKDDEQTPSSDKMLVKLVSQGDEPALAVLYQRHSSSLFNYLLRLVHERAVAEDLLQEVFLAIWRGAGRFQGRSRAKTWLFGIAHNQAVSWLRRNSREKQESQLPESESPAGPESYAMAAWNREQVQIALARLSVAHRSVVELAFVQGLSYAEIATVMDCPVGTVKSRMSYALRHLEQMLIWQDVDR